MLQTLQNPATGWNPEATVRSNGVNRQVESFNPQNIGTPAGYPVGAIPAAGWVNPFIAGYAQPTFTTPFGTPITGTPINTTTPFVNNYPFNTTPYITGAPIVGPTAYTPYATPFANIPGAAINPAFIAAFNPTFNPAINPTFNPTFNTPFGFGYNPMLNPAFNPAFNPAMNPLTAGFQPTTNPYLAAMTGSVNTLGGIPVGAAAFNTTPFNTAPVNTTTPFAAVNPFATPNPFATINPFAAINPYAAAAFNPITSVYGNPLVANYLPQAAYAATYANPFFRNWAGGVDGQWNNLVLASNPYAAFATGAVNPLQAIQQAAGLGHPAIAPFVTPIGTTPITPYGTINTPFNTPTNTIPTIDPIAAINVLSNPILNPLAATTLAAAQAAWLQNTPFNQWSNGAPFAQPGLWATQNPWINGTFCNVGINGFGAGINAIPAIAAANAISRFYGAVNNPYIGTAISTNWNATAIPGSGIFGTNPFVNNGMNAGPTAWPTTGSLLNPFGASANLCANPMVCNC